MPARRLLPRAAKFGLATGVAASFGFVALVADDPDNTHRIRRAARASAAFARLAAEYKLESTLHGSQADAADRLIAQHHRGAEQVLQLCRMNGGIFVKAGQHAASLRPAIPEEYIEALSTLQDQARAVPIEQVRLMIAHELEAVGGLDNFTEIHEMPLGTASLAQVHAARLLDGSPVAIKVQHSKVKGDIKSDLSMMRVFNKLAGWMFPGFSLAWAVDELESHLDEELDFKREASHAARARFLVESDSALCHRVWVPAVMPALSTTRVLTMELVDNAIPIHKVDALTEAGVDVAVVRSVVLDLFGKMFFRWGFVHCDPHPGNILIVPKGKENLSDRIALLDHGLYRSIDEHFRLHNCSLWKAMALQQRSEVEKHCTALGIGQLADVLPALLTNRPLESRTALGEDLPANEIAQARSVTRGMSLNELVDVLPRDMVFVMRAMHLIKDLNEELLGGSRAERFHRYVLLAADGLWEDNQITNKESSDEGGGSGGVGLGKLMNGVGRSLDGWCFKTRLASWHAYKSVWMWAWASPDAQGTRVAFSLSAEAARAQK